LEQGGVPRRVFGKRQQMERDAHASVVALTEGMTGKGQPHEWFWKDLRRKRRSIFGGLFRFIDLLHKRKRPISEALELRDKIDEYIRAVYAGNPGDGAVLPVQLWKTGEFERAA
jgi:hypothetical protein